MRRLRTTRATAAYSSPVSLRRSRTSSRWVRLLQAAARLSRFSIASRRRLWLEERSAGPDHGLEQRRLAVGRGAQHLQVAAPDAEAGELGAGLDDLAVGVVVELRRPRRCPGWTSRQSSSSLISSGATPVCVDQLLDASSASPCPPRRVLARRSAVAGALLAGAGRELLADHPQRQELVALHAEDRRAAARRRPGCRGGSRRACAAARAASGPRGSGSSRSRCPRTRGRGSWRRRRSSAPCGSTERCPAASGRVDRAGSGEASIVTSPGSSACTCRSGSRRRPRACGTRSGGG